MKTHSTLVGLVCILAILSSAQVEAAKKKPAKAGKKSEATVDNSKTAGGLKLEDVKAGTGPEAVSGKEVTVHYTGKLTDGKKFDSSLDRKQPFKFILGAGQVISGWDKGVAGMKVGGKRKLTIPPDMGYGKNGVPGVIPPDSTLVFDVELLAVGS
ncbi:MAG: FKBP-type peptidyl-prolyl cis-trans isomerase [Deltaproteobacteria bacterium]|nr:FKBP-type peptidyl-prolyl cis-trans isomerase [Deltaproteobacteria bacterium]MBI3294415.1 FKBP-type peptidyl-prolyl cis-trans isomerase [Deltaproteobacteria bacterium]